MYPFQGKWHNSDIFSCKKSFGASSFSKNEKATLLAHLNLQCFPFVINSNTSHCLTFLFLKTRGHRTRLKLEKHISQFSNPYSVKPSPWVGVFADLIHTFSSSSSRWTLWAQGKPKHIKRPRLSSFVMSKHALNMHFFSNFLS